VSRAIALSVLGLLVIALAGTIAFELRHDAEADAEPSAAAGDSETSGRVAAPAPQAKEEDLPDFVDDILARPLFALNRKPVALPSNAPSPVAGPAGTTVPRLAGVIMTSDAKFAIFQPRDPAKPVSVEEGDDIAGRKVQSIDFEEVVLLGPDGEEHLHPTPDPAIEAAAAAMGLDNPDTQAGQPPRRPVRPGVLPRPGINRPGLPRPPGVQLPGRPNPANAVRGRPPVNVGGRPPQPPNRVQE